MRRDVQSSIGFVGFFVTLIAGAAGISVLAVCAFAAFRDGHIVLGAALATVDVVWLGVVHFASTKFLEWGTW